MRAQTHTHRHTFKDLPVMAGIFRTCVNSFQKCTNKKPRKHWKHEDFFFVFCLFLKVLRREEIETKTFTIEPFHCGTPYFDASFRSLPSSLISFEISLSPGSVSEASATAPYTVPRRVLTQREPAAEQCP